MGSGKSGLAPSSLSDFFGGTGNILGKASGLDEFGTLSKLGSQWGKEDSPFLSSVGGLGGYQKGLDSIISGNQDYLKDLISGGGGTDWNKIAKGIMQLGKGVGSMGSPEIPTTGGGGTMQTMQFPKMDLGGIGGGLPARLPVSNTLKMPSLPMIDLLKAVNVIKNRMRGEQ